MWRFHVHDTVTGNRLERVYPVTGSWTRALSGQGSGSHSFDVFDEATTFDAMTWEFLLKPNARMIVVSWNDTPVYAGVVLSYVYDRDSRRLVVSHREVRCLFKNRLTFPVNRATEGTFRVEGRSGSGAARRIIRQGTEWTANWNLPIVLSDDGSGEITKEWRWYEARTIEDCLAELEDEGWEIDFHPERRTDGGVQFRMRVGKPYLAGVDEYHLTAADTPITNLSVTVDGAEQLTGVFVSGNGTGEDIRHAWAGGLGAVDIPIRDMAVGGSSERDGAGLGRIAQAHLAERRYPLVQWSFQVNTGSVNPVEFTPARRIRVVISRDWFLPDGVQTLRIVSVKGDMGPVLYPEVQPSGS